MSLFNERAATQRLLRREGVAIGSPVDFGTSYGASLRANRLSNATIGDTLSLQEAYDAYADEAFQATGKRIRTPFDPAEASPAEQAREMEARTVEQIEAGVRGPFNTEPPPARPVESLEAREQRFFEDMAALGVTPPTRDQVQERAYGIVREAVEENEDIAPRAGFTSQFLGSAVAVVTDPPVFATMAFGAPAASGILRTALIESGIAGLTETAIQPRIQGFRERAGLPAGFEEGVENVLTAMGGGAVFGGLFKGAVLSGRRLLDAYRSARTPQTSAEEAADRYLERFVELQEANPFIDSPVGSAEHARRLSLAMQRLRDPEAGPLDFGRPRVSVRDELLSGSSLSTRPEPPGPSRAQPDAQDGAASRETPSQTVRVAATNKKGQPSIFDTRREAEANRAKRRDSDAHEVVELEDGRFALVRETQAAPLALPGGEARTFPSRRAAEKFIERTRDLPEDARVMRTGRGEYTIVTGATERDIAGAEAMPELARKPERAVEARASDDEVAQAGEAAGAALRARAIREEAAAIGRAWDQVAAKPVGPIDDDTGRLITVHIQEPDRAGADTPLSEKITGAPESPVRSGESPPGDTAAGPYFQRPQGRAVPARENVGPKARPVNIEGLEERSAELDEALGAEIRDLAGLDESEGADVAILVGDEARPTTVRALLKEIEEDEALLAEWKDCLKR